MPGKVLKIVEWFVTVPADHNKKNIISSPDFPITHNGKTTLWRLLHGFNDQEDKSCSLFLKPIDPKEALSVDCELMILDSVDVSKANIKHLQAPLDEWLDGLANGANLISHVNLFNEVNNYIVNGKIHFVVVIRECEEEETVTTTAPAVVNSHQQEVFSEIISESHEIVHLNCSDGKKIRALKKIICNKSDVFQKMFEIDMTERAAKSVDIIDFDSEVMSELLHFLYFGNVRTFFEKYDIQVYEAAKVYMIGELQKLCVESIENRLDAMNVQEIVEFANVYGEHSLYEDCVLFIWIFYSVKGMQDILKSLPNELRLQILEDAMNATRGEGIHCKF